MDPETRNSEWMAENKMLISLIEKDQSEISMVKEKLFKDIESL